MDPLGLERRGKHLLTPRNYRIEGVRRTVVETVLQLLNLHPHAHILLCAPSNPATDTLVSRLAKHLAPKELLRLNDPNRSFAEVPDELKFFCCMFVFPFSCTLITILG